MWDTLFSLLYSGYDPSDYNHLQVTPEIRELFKHISRYTPQTIGLECRLVPFVPEYIPAIGDIDAFIKVRLEIIVIAWAHMNNRVYTET